MEYAIINTCDWGSTGRIAVGLLNHLNRKSKKAIFCYGRGANIDNEERYRFSTKIEVLFHALYTNVTGLLNGASVLATKRLIRRLRKEKVRSIFLVNLHGKIINERIFGEYLVNDKINVVYIMADESAFLGNCTYRNGCNRYKEGCKECQMLNRFQRLLNPHVSAKAFSYKQSSYSNLNIVFIAPEFVINSGAESPLLQNQKTQIVDEAINVKVNCPRETSSLRKQIGISKDKIIIGCVAPYGAKHKRKGVEYFISAAKKLEQDDRFVFIHVGYLISDKSGLPRNYVPVGFVDNQEKLACYYSLFDVFVFPSIEDTMPNACLEALACGTPLVCFNISGMPYLGDNSVMTLVDPCDIEQLTDIISGTTRKTNEIISTCREYALKRYDSAQYFGRIEAIMNDLRNNNHQ